MYAKIAKILAQVTMKLCKEYLKALTCNTADLRQMKTEQFDMCNTFLWQHIRELENSPILGHPVYAVNIYFICCV